MSHMRLGLFISICSIFVIAFDYSYAQQYRYMDSSGNIRFVDSLNEVPSRYRQQIVPPTPTPALDARQRRELQMNKQRDLVERKRKEQIKQKEMERMRRTIEREQRMNTIRGGKLVEPTPKAQIPQKKEDAIEVIK